MRPLVLALLLAPLAAAADPNPQLLRSLATRLPQYGLHVDVRTLSTRQAGALHLTMASGNDSYLEKRRKLEAILRWDKEDQR